MPPTPAQLLRATDKAGDYVDPKIASVINRLTADGRLDGPGDDAVLAIASLGSTNKIIDTLMAAGAIPASLSDRDLERLSARTGLTTNDWHNPSRIADAHAEIAAFLGLPAVRAEAVVPLPVGADASYPLFRHQRRALRQVIDILSSGGIALLHMPTGAGKTRTAMNAVCDTLRRHEGKAILWIATMKELLEQGTFEFEKAWRALGDRNDIKIVHAYESRDWLLDEIGDGIVFATPQTLRARHERMMLESQSSLYALLADRVSLIVFDEAHQSTATTYREVLEGVAHATHPRIPILGLSATPGRTYRGSDDDYALIDLFDGTKVTLDTSDSGYDNPIDYLIGNGYLAKPEFRLLGDLEPADPDQRPAPMKAVDYVVFVVEAVLDLLAEGHTRIMVFARSVEESDLVAGVLRVAGVAAASVSGNTPSDERDTAAREYKAPGTTPRVLVNFGVYTAGFDAPQTSAVVIARPVRSLVAYSQMAGRGIRGIAAGGNDHAVIATVVDPSEPAFGDIATAFTNWNEMWE
jgi:superfamily II DNA or RNA helicase